VNEAVYYGVGELGSKAINEALPVTISGLSGEIKQVLKTGADLLERGVKAQTDKALEKYKDTDKKK
jgi:hypothetical protein